VGESPVGKNVNTGTEDNDKDTADWEDSVRAVANCRLYEKATEL
jgi:hypothetical protein